MSLGRTSRKKSESSKKKKKATHHQKSYARKPYKRKKVALRGRKPGMRSLPPPRAHKVMDLPVMIQRNPNAGKTKNAMEVCIAIPARKNEGGEKYACAAGKNPRSATAKALRKAASAISARTGTFAGIS